MNSIVLLLLAYTRFFALQGGGDMVIRNPFSLLRIQGEGAKIEMALYGARNRERWGILTYDRYDNTVGDMGIYTKTLLYSNMPSFIVSYAKKNFAVSLGYLPLLNFDYKYESNLKDANYLPSNNYDINRTGGLSLLGVGAEGRFKRFYGGTYFAYGKGRIEQTEFYSDTIINWILDLKGFIPYAYMGATLDNVELMLGFNPRVSLSSNPLPVYPMSVYTSLALFRPSPLMDRATFEFIYRFYEKAGYLTDGFTVLAGLEHTSYNNFFFTLKAGIEKTYLEQDTYVPVYKVSFGQTFAGMKIFGALEYQNVKYSRYDSASGEYANVTENTLRFNVGLQIKP